jgi:hydrogenase maturation protease
MKKTLILGIGNYLLSDDGVGVHAVQKLERTKQIPEEVQVVDGGTCGLDLLHFLEGIERLIIVDAVKTKHPAGTIIRLEGDAIPAYLTMKVSPHEIGMPELLAAAKLRDIYPAEVIVLGVQPESLAMSVDLTPAVAASLDKLIELVMKEIKA